MTVFAYAALTLTAPALVLALGTWGLRLDLAVLVVASLTGMVVRFAEQRAPFEPIWNRSHADAGVDVLHLLLSTVAVEVVFSFGAKVLPSLALWPSSASFALQVGLGLLIAELGAYGAHRAMHAIRPLWRLHLVHHSARRLYSMNASRNHPLDSLVLLVAAGVPLMVLGAPAQVIAALAAFAIVHLQFQHANAALELGPFNWLLAGPELHRWHHSRVPEEANANYGHVLAVWDVVFRTRRFPVRRPPSDVGLFDRSGLPERYVDQLAAPFR